MFVVLAEIHVQFKKLLFVIQQNAQKLIRKGMFSRFWRIEAYYTRYDLKYLVLWKFEGNRSNVEQSANIF